MDRAGVLKALPHPLASRTGVRISLWWGISLLFTGASLALLGLYLFSPRWMHLQGELPVSMQSPLQANYQADPLSFSLPPVRTAILAEVLADRRDSDPVDALATLVKPLQTPVPSITPSLPASGASAPTAVPLLQTPGNTTPEVPVPQPTAARPTASVTATRLATRTAAPTLTPSVTRTVTRTPFPTLAATRTPVVVTAQPTLFLPTATSGRINEPAPTSPPPATAVPPTRVPTQPPVPTLEPPTPVPPPPPAPTEEPGYPPPPPPPQQETPAGYP